MDHVKTLLIELAEKGVSLSLVDDNIRFSAPDGALTPELVERLRANKPALVELLQGQREALPPIEPAPPADRYPASRNQQIIFDSHKVDTRSNRRHNLWLIPVDAAHTTAEIEDALGQVVARHEGLRTVFVEEVGDDPTEAPTLHQVVQPAEPLTLTHQAVGSDDELTAFLRIFSRPPFDLTAAPPLRGAHVTGPDGARVAICLHEIISDGSSHKIVADDLATVLGGQPLEPLTLQYKDFAAWHRGVLDSSVGARSLAHVTGRLSGPLPRTYLPFDRIGSADAIRGRRHRVTLDPDAFARLRQVSADTSASLNSLVQAALTLVLHKLSGERDVIYSSAISLRHTPELHRVVGLFVGTLFLRHRVEVDDTIRSLVDRVNAENLSALDHRYFDLVAALDEVDQRWEPDRFIVTPVILNHLTYASRAEYDEMQAPLMTDAWREPKVELELYVRDFPDGMELTCDYRADLFSDEVIEALIDELVAALDGLGDLDRSLAEVQLRDPDRLPATDHRLARTGFATELPHDNVGAWFEAAAERFGDEVAVSESGTGRSLTYAELARQARVLAAQLSAGGVDPAEPVVVSVADPLARCATILALIRLGAIFCPFDPALPIARQMAQLEAIHPRAVITDGVGDLTALAADVGSGNGSAAPVVRRFRLGSGPAPAGFESLDPAVDEAALRPVVPFTYGHDTPSYLFFTSGSTGTPKPILGRMASIVQFVDWELGALDLPSQPRVAQVASPTFDASLRDVFVPLVTGGTACFPADRAGIAEGSALLDWLEADEVHLVHCTPTTLRTMLAAEPTGDRLPALRAVLCSGEPLLPADAERWQEAFGSRIVLGNLYGPTEATMVRTFSVVPQRADHGDELSVGKPIADTVVLIVDDDRQLCGFEQVGEVYIGSPFLTLGYYRQPELTAESFVDLHDVDPELVVPFYRTGDLGARNTDGTLRLLGRRDRQLKINGVRVEPQELEATARAVDGVEASAVKVVDRGDGPPQLVLYVTGGADTDDLRRELVSRLPTWLVPAHVEAIEALPLTPSNKVDYERLPVPDALQASAAADAERTETEERMAEIWSSILDRSALGPDDNFFMLGGNSLKALLLISQIERTFQVQPVMRDIFLNATLRACSSHVDELILQTSVFRVSAPAEGEDAEARTGGFL